MVAAASPFTRPANPRFAAWLLLAALLHTPLLWLPTGRDPLPERAFTRLTVTLQKADTTGKNFVAPAEESPPVATETPPRPDAPAMDKTVPDYSAPAIRPDRPEKSTPSLSAARLLDLAGQREWKLAEPSDPLRLGGPRMQRTPENWRPSISPKPNRFAEVFAREKLEIVDRWLAADGSHNVVINTPSGETYCGRAEAWSPLNPLLEPIMMWRPCGGGGKRTFDWPDRYRSTASGSDQR